MTCLNDAQIQALADGEASGPEREHLLSCQRCSERLRERQRRSAALLTAVQREVEVPAHLARRIDAALLAGSGSGATRLRSDARPPRRRAFWSATIAVAATIVAILFVAPMIKGPATVSAAGILAASATRLNARLAGVEVLEYELAIDGAPKAMMPDHADGTYRIWQAIDHDTPGRFRFSSFRPDGRPISSIAQDPVHHRRVTMMMVEEQPYRFETTLPDDMAMSLPEIERLHMEATVTMMQASGNQLLQVIDTPDGQQYQIEVQHEGNGTTNPVWDLTSARVVVKAEDYRILEFAVKGTVFKKPYSVSYKLIRRTLGASLQADAFEVPAEPGQIELAGEGTALPARDAMVLAFRELSRLRQER
jgi:hypothetical protein